MIEVVNPDAFTPGQTVQVFDQDGRPFYIGTVVRYWRNNAFTVRESEHGTTCNHHVRDLELLTK